jgi:hypothetical protein
MSLAAKMTGRAGMSREKSECLIRDAREQTIVKIATEAASETKEMDRAAQVSADRLRLVRVRFHKQWRN